MIHLSVPVLAHSTAVCPTSPNHFTHSSFLCISTRETTAFHEHNFSPQDKQILYSIYSDVLRITKRIQTIFPADPSLALSELAELNKQLSSTIL